MRVNKLRASGVTWVVAGLLTCAVAPQCFAASEEIQVYMDDLSEPGQFGVDVHNNYVISGASKPEYQGQQPPAHVYRLTPEFYYGLTDTVELGLYVLSSRSSNGTTNMDGEKLRIKYIAPHDMQRGAFWGANFELGRTDQRVSETPWNAELKGIYGYRWADWSLAVNANVDWSVSDASQPAALDISTKVAYRLNDKNQIGLESYNDVGSLHAPESLDKQSQVLYAVVDSEVGQFDINAGIGRALTTASDRWVLKFIVGTHF